MDQGELTYIKIPYPKTEDLHLKILVPLCSLIISPGIGNAWVTGKYHDPKDVMALNVTQEGNVAEIVAVGAFAYRVPRKFLPALTLSLGRLHPFSLSISAGDLIDHLDLGAIPLSSLEIHYGEGSQSIDFSYPNPQLLNRMKIEADKGPVQIEHLANANAAVIQLNGDSAHYRLNFGGELKRTTNLHAGMAVSTTEVFIPSAAAVKVKSRTPPASSQTDDFIYVDKEYCNRAARDRQEPLLDINAPYGVLKIHYF